MPKAKNSLEFGRLTTQDIPQISRFLNEVYSMPQYFGKIGTLYFDEEYLSWLYGGPNRHRNILSGAWIDGHLVAYQAFLYREYYYQKTLKSYLTTHMSISPSMDSKKRMECIYRFWKQLLIFRERSEFHDTNCDLVIGFIDQTKKTGPKIDSFIKKEWQIDLTPFCILEIFVVIPNRLRIFLKQNADRLVRYHVRDADLKDIPCLTSLFNRPSSDRELKMVMQEDELEHHLFGGEAHHTAVLEEDGRIKGFINYYPMKGVKYLKEYSSVIIEFIHYEYYCPELVALLMNRAIQFADEIGSRIIAIENTSYLQKEDFKDFGLASGLRKLVLYAAEKEKLLPVGGIFRGDVK